MEGRKAFALGVALLVILLYPSVAAAKPSFNGTTAGCGGSSCHTFQSGIVTASTIGNQQVRVTLSGAGTRVAGELVDGSGAVVAVIDQTQAIHLHLPLRNQALIEYLPVITRPIVAGIR